MLTLITRLALAGAILGGVAGCGGGSSDATSAPHTATTTPAPPERSPLSPASSPAIATSAPAPEPPPATRPVAGRLAGRDWTYIPTTRHVIALTFDAGANADGLPSILATLSREHVPATFFLTGGFTRGFPAYARQIAAAGFLIGNHTNTHPHLTQLSDAAVRQELLRAGQQIRAVTGANPAPVFRFPYGDTNARVIAIANDLGYVAVRWTVDTLGWEGTSAHITTATVNARALGALRPGEIVLMHVGSNPDDHSTLDADALPALIGQLRTRGYSFVTLDALTG